MLMEFNIHTEAEILFCHSLLWNEMLNEKPTKGRLRPKRTRAKQAFQHFFAIVHCMYVRTCICIYVHVCICTYTLYVHVCTTMNELVVALIPHEDKRYVLEFMDLVLVILSLPTVRYVCV